MYFKNIQWTIIKKDRTSVVYLEDKKKVLVSLNKATRTYLPKTTFSSFVEAQPF